MTEYLYTLNAGNSAAHIVRLNSTPELTVMVENKDGLTDFPTLYADDTIGYTHPEWYTKKVKRGAEVLLHVLKLHTFAAKYHNGWHSYSRDKLTSKAVSIAAEIGLIDTNEYNQFTHTPTEKWC